MECPRDDRQVRVSFSPWELSQENDTLTILAPLGYFIEIVKEKKKHRIKKVHVLFIRGTFFSDRPIFFQKYQLNDRLCVFLFTLVGT